MLLNGKSISKVHLYSAVLECTATVKQWSALHCFSAVVNIEVNKFVIQAVGCTQFLGGISCHEKTKFLDSVETVVSDECI